MPGRAAESSAGGTSGEESGSTMFSTIIASVTGADWSAARGTACSKRSSAKESGISGISGGERVSATVSKAASGKELGISDRGSWDCEEVSAGSEETAAIRALSGTESAGRSTSEFAGRSSALARG